MAMAVFGVGAMFGPVIGPALGGWVTDNINWRWIFYINVPFGILAVILVSYFVFDPEYLKKKSRIIVDYWGWLCSASALSLAAGARQGATRRLVFLLIYYRRLGCRCFGTGGHGGG